MAEDEALRAEIIRWCERGVDAPLDDDAFDGLARRVFRHNVEHDDAYAAYCERRGVTPASVDHWTRIPAVPTAAFKELDLVSGDPGAAALTFRTSGTTRGPERRGVHHVLEPGLYDASLLPTFAAYLLPDRRGMAMLSLIPPPAEEPDSSLAYMVGAVLDRFGARGSGYATADGAPDFERLGAMLDDLDGEAVCLLGASAAFVHWLDALDRDGRAFRLPEGSRLMDTGGYKGRGRDVPENELRDAYVRCLGLAPDHCVNEYGMTELLSQFYDSTLRDRHRGDADPVTRRRKLGPPWVRTLVMDPETLEPVQDGETGILAHYDLANMDAVMAVQTEDVGVRMEDGFRLLGRTGAAPPRGCSIAMDLLLQDRAP